MEDLAYRRLIDEYYLSERPLSGCSTDVARLIGMADHESSVSYVLNRYFVSQDNKWVHERIDNEIDLFKSKQEKAVLAGRASAESRRNKGNLTDVQPTFSERSTTVQLTKNQEPITNNHKPIKNKTTSQPDKPVDVSDSVWADFLQIRKAKRSPMTDTALQQIRAEADKAGITLQTALEHSCARGWQGFKAQWLREATSPRASPTQSETAYQRSMRERWEEATGQKASDHANVIDITPTQTEKLRIA